jgi:hypothetical protein
VFQDNFTHYQPPKHLDNLFNPNMNNVTAIDYQNKDITESDGVLPRWCQEYPRMSSNFRDKTKHKPWGSKDPIYFEHWQDSHF